MNTANGNATKTTRMTTNVIISMEKANDVHKLKKIMMDIMIAPSRNPKPSAYHLNSIFSPSQQRVLLPSTDNDLDHYYNNSFVQH
jgi:hypothetical protein